METTERFEAIKQKGVEDIRLIKQVVLEFSEAYNKIKHL